MRTLRKINKPIKFFGLTSIQFGVIMLFYALVIIICVFAHLHPLIVVTIISIMAFISGMLFKNLSKEHKAGNPDYLTSLSVKSVTPSKIVDKCKVCLLYTSPSPRDCS